MSRGRRSRRPRRGSWRRVGPPCPVLKHGPRSARGAPVPRARPGRSGGRARVGSPERRRSESKCRSRAGGRENPFPGCIADRVAVTQWPASSGSASVATRKMVNYAREGRSQRKLWWRPAAVLTCKSIVRLGYRGERLIEPSSSWFPPKFPSG